VGRPKFYFRKVFNMTKPIKLPAKFEDAIAAMPEYSYGAHRVVVTLDDGTKVWDVFVAAYNEIVKVGTSTEIPFDPNRVVEVRCQ
jgi:hypothetical protein